MEKVENPVEGNVYYLTRLGNTKKPDWLIKYKSAELYLEDNKLWLDQKHDFVGDSYHFWKVESQKEKDWIEAMVKERRFIPFGEIQITENYSIF